MYNIDLNTFGKNFKKYRKSRNLTLEQIGKQINKSKATVSKYEKSEIVPDILTTLEICNTLDISLSQLFPTIANKKNLNMHNPFTTNILFMYYYTENKLITSVIELNEEDKLITVKYYNGIKNISTYADESSYKYDGILECDKTIGYINLVNSESQNTQLEKLQISFNIPWSKKFEITNFFMLGLTPNSIPIVKKGIISVSPITDLSNFKDDLKIMPEELLKLENNNGWILENKNYAHFFFDK